MKMDRKLIDSQVSDILRKTMKNEVNILKLENELLNGAEGGLEIKDSFDKWLEDFRFQSVWLTNDDYSKALVRALWLAPQFAGTDFGSSRQRDMGQVWTDTARGFLGEIAFASFLKERFDIEIKTDARRGALSDFLPTDVPSLRIGAQEWKKPEKSISVKTTKFNGRWLDLPGAQYAHSDVYVLVKIGILRQHFLAFLKAISFMKDKLFVKAKSLGELDDDKAKELWDEIPEFEPIPAFVAGYLMREDVKLPIHMLNARKKGKNKVVVSQGIGLFTLENLRSDKRILDLDPDGTKEIEIEPIIKSYSGQHFFAHSGGLKSGSDDWKKLISLL